MHVAVVSPYDLDVPGGVQDHVRHLAHHLRELGDRVTTLSPGGPRDDPDHVRLGASVQVPFNGSVAPIALAPTVLATTVAALGRLGPDVVHVHEPTVPLVGLTATRTARVPVVATFHAWSRTDRLYRAARPVARLAVRRISRRIAVSEAAAAYHGGALGLRADAFVVIPNGVDVGTHASAAPFADLRDGRPTVVTVGRIEPRKGLEVLIEAFATVAARRPGCRLVVVGDGPGRARCESAVPEALRADVRFVGRVPDEDKRRYLASGDVFAAPALGGESFGIVLVEALAAGVPVVASDLPGFRSVLTDGVDGRLVPPGDAELLAGVLDLLLGNAALRQALATAGRDRAQRFDWPLVAARIRDVYRLALGG